MPRVVMLEESPMPEYHGEFDAIPGNVIELPIEKAVDIIEKFPKMFKPVDFDLEEALQEMRKTSGENGDLVKIVLKFNPVMDQYHGIDLDFDEVGDEREVTYERAKELFSKFPGVFDLVRTFQEAEIKPDEIKTNSVEPKMSEEYLALVEGKILNLLSQSSRDYHELMLLMPEESSAIKSRLARLSRVRLIEKDNEDKWILKVSNGESTTQE